MLNICNELVYEYFPKYFKEIKNIDCLKILGKEEENIKNLVYII